MFLLLELQNFFVEIVKKYLVNNFTTIFLQFVHLVSRPDLPRAFKNEVWNSDSVTAGLAANLDRSLYKAEWSDSWDLKKIWFVIRLKKSRTKSSKVYRDKIYLCITTQPKAGRNTQWRSTRKAGRNMQQTNKSEKLIK